MKLCGLAIVFMIGLAVGSAAWWEIWADDPYNRFVKLANDYAATQNRGVIDLKKLHRMRAAWRELEKSAGWPDEPCR